MSAVEHFAPPHTQASQEGVRVMVVDDSVVVRGLISSWIAEEPGLQVVAALRTGQEAVTQLARVNPDVVILDIEMPELDGLAALPLLLRQRDDLVVIMVSALTRKHAEYSLKALALGAADYVTKPNSSRGLATTSAFRRELTDKIRQLGWHKRRSATPITKTRAHAIPPLHPVSAKSSAVASPMHAVPPFKLRAFAACKPSAILIGASTGGPQAITTLLRQLAPALGDIPVLIAQHMPASFTGIFAGQLRRATGMPALVPADGEVIRAGHIYVAPGDRHMLVTSVDGQARIALDDGPPEHFCKPAVDPLFASAGAVWGAETLAIILTGMGADGTRGAAAITDAGGSVIAQDEPSSAIWGMPGSAAHAGICARVLALEAMPAVVARVIAGARA
jgi:two-component system chemotaxis response regulator CheB